MWGFLSFDCEVFLSSSLSPRLGEKAVERGRMNLSAKPIPLSPQLFHEVLTSALSFQVVCYGTINQSINHWWVLEKPGFQSLIGQFIAMWPSESHWWSLSLSFLICKFKIMTPLHLCEACVLFYLSLIVIIITIIRLNHTKSFWKSKIFKYWSFQVISNILK